MAILKIKQLEEKLKAGTQTVIADSAAFATSAGNAGTAYKATSAGQAGTARIALYGSAGTGALA